METDFKKVADDFMKSPAGSKLKKGDLNKIIGSEDGQRVKQMIESGSTDIMGAVKKGDMDTLKNTVTDILKTEEGARLAQQLMKLMK